VEGTAVGEEFWLFFTGALGPIPFDRIHLPAFVLPRLHAPLAGLLSANPLVGQRIRKNATPPVAHPGNRSTEMSCRLWEDLFYKSHHRYLTTLENIHNLVEKTSSFDVRSFSFLLRTTSSWLSGLLSTWKLSTDVSVLPFGLDVMLRMRDGSISAFQGMLLSDETLRARCESSGSLDQEKLKIEVSCCPTEH